MLTGEACGQPLGEEHCPLRRLRGPLAPAPPVLVLRTQPPVVPWTARGGGGGEAGRRAGLDFTSPVAGTFTACVSVSFEYGFGS